MSLVTREIRAAAAAGADAPPVAAIIGVSFRQDGRPEVDVPVAVVGPGDEVIWCVATGDRRAFRVEFDRGPPRPLPQVDRERPGEGPAEIRAGDDDCDPPPNEGALTLDDPVLGSVPWQAARMRISHDAAPGVYFYRLSEDGGTADEAEEPPPERDGELMLYVTSRPIIRKGDRPL